MFVRKTLLAVLLCCLLTVSGCVHTGPGPEATEDHEAAVVTEAPTAAPTAEPTEAPTVYPAVDPLEIRSYPMEQLLYGWSLFSDPVYNDLANGDNTGVLWNRFDDFLYRADRHGCVPAIRDDEGYEYAVFDTDEGYRLFIHLSDGIISEKRMVGYTIILKDVHSHSDFASLKKGDPIDLVSEIDPVAGIVKEAAKRSNLTPEWARTCCGHHWGPSSFHYLTDGVLRIEYTMDDAGELFINSIVYSGDYTLKSIVTVGLTVNYSLLPCDMPEVWQETLERTTLDDPT